MDETPPRYEMVLRTRQRHECLESRLVLDALGISAEVVHREGWWCLLVNADDLAYAESELDSYRRENLDRSAVQGTVVPVYGGGEAALFVYAGLIIMVFILTAQGALGVDWLETGRMQAGKVMAGEWWRNVTALTLHLDTGHIASNLVFGIVFGLLAGRVLGGGVAWLGIVLAGALGNFINALVQAPAHSSIGASTAVFAALGIVVSHALRHWRSGQEKPLRRWSPLIGGVLLLAFTGVGGERTDVVAHLTGFLAGLLVGWVGSGMPDHWLAKGAVQTLAGFATIAIVIIAWIIALTAA